MKTLKLLLAGGAIALAGQVAVAEFVYVTDTADLDTAANGKTRSYTHDGNDTNDTLWLWRGDFSTDAPIETFTLDWKVTQISPILWQYEYTFLASENALSHMTIEVSPTFSGAQQGLSADGTLPHIKNGNDKLPEPELGNYFDSYYYKFPEASGSPNPVTYTLLTDRAPVWGDVFLKDGQWDLLNKGFGTDPTHDTTDFSYWIVVPDTVSTFGGPPPVVGGDPMPTPIAAGMGLIGFGIIGLRRQRKVRA